MLEEKVLHTIKEHNLIEKGDNIVVGVSGGPDSITLINILKTLQKNIEFKVYVAHINHLIRQEAYIDQKYVEEYCSKNNIECFVKQINVDEIAKQDKIGTEEAGRKVRYDFFEEILKKTNSNKIATAHTANDNAETVLMNMIRGSGTSRTKRNTSTKRKHIYTTINTLYKTRNRTILFRRKIKSTNR